MTTSLAAPLHRSFARLVFTNVYFWMFMGSVALTSFVTYFFSSQENMAVSLENERNFDPEMANAVKHAYTAAQVYTVLTNLHISNADAINITNFLGKTNEYAERLLKSDKPDTTLEMMKDMHNNQAGISAAKWYKEHKNEAEGLTLHDVVVVLAQQNVLINSANHVPLNKTTEHLKHGAPDILSATAWFDGMENTIKRHVDARLAAIYEPNTNPIALFEKN